ncbi:MAG: AraC family ligand binding domain-containing protein, partial [Oscillospiraceae bacterium]|nr:AraC family ligand binding domain-containing protein [Oscillospiraceae bacterium]
MERDITLHYNIKGEEPVELLHAMETRHYFPAHFHRGWCVNMLYRGERPFVYKRESFIQHPEQIVLINPGDVHECGKGVEDLYSMYHITFNDLSIERLFSMPVNTEPEFTQAVVDDVRLAASIRSDAEKLLRSHSAMGMEELHLDVIERLRPYLTGVNYPEKQPVGDSRAFLKVRDYIND